MEEWCKKYLEKTQYVINATSFEVVSIWEKYSTEAICKTKLNRYDWKQVYYSFFVTISHFNKEPINLSLRWFYINDILVMFYDCISLVSHIGIIQQWIKNNCYPYQKDGRPATTDANNFHICIQYIDELNKNGRAIQEVQT